MSTSFIIFVVIVVAVVATAAFRLGIVVSKATKKESATAKNTIPYKDCRAQNAAAFKYGSFKDERDGQTYHTVKIGNQVWMAENLRYKANNSYAPNGEEENVETFGRLYTWTTALNIPDEFTEKPTAEDVALYEKIQDKNFQGLAPEGWHIPSNMEWEQLMANLALNSEGNELRSACIWHNPGSDSLGFFALPAGYRFGNGNYCHFGDRARFWSKDEYGKSNAFRLSITNESVDIEGVYRSDALSIRCVKNA